MLANGAIRYLSSTNELLVIANDLYTMGWDTKT